MSNNKLFFLELSRSRLSANRTAVIAVRSDNSYCISQEVDVLNESTGERFKRFEKNSIVLKDIQSLYELRDAINIAITNVENTEWKGE